MSRTFTLPLLAALPAVLASCGERDDLGRYSRVQYASYEQCMTANRVYIQQGLANPCQKSTRTTTGGFLYYGPYTRYMGGSTRFVGYTPSGGVASSGLTFDSKRGSYGTFKAPGVSRGGFTSSARASGSARSGSFGG